MALTTALEIQFEYLDLIIHGVGEIPALRFAGQARFAEQAAGADHVFDNVFFLRVDGYLDNTFQQEKHLVRRLTGFVQYLVFAVGLHHALR